MNDSLWIEKAKNWSLNEDFSQDSRLEIETLIQKDEVIELKDRFYKDLEFGTGGMRGIIGAGTNRINIYTVRRITKAIALSLLDKGNNSPSGLRAVVCYDSRRYSKEFAAEVCSIFNHYGIKTYLFSRLNPVALLSFAIRELKAHTGVMITASHNPINYNGYKAYGENGAQVTPPLDSQIEEKYANISYLDAISTKSNSINNPIYLGEDFEKSYLDKIKSCAFNLDLIKKQGNQLKIVYTPIHGTGLIPVTAALKDWGFSQVFVNEIQKNPDSNFPSVKSPNPEDPAALKLVVDQMLHLQADVAYGTDPDTDRLGVVINLHQDQQKVLYLNGNEIGALLLYYFLEESQARNSLTPQTLVVKSIVTSTIQDKMCKHFNIQCLTTLTGFKWMCLEMDRFLQENPQGKFLFASEESFGVLTHPYCRDKDAVAGIAHFSEMLLWLKIVKKMTVVEYLDSIHQKFGYHKESLISKDYPESDGQIKMQTMMNNLRQESLSTLNTNLEKNNIDDSIVKRIDFLTPQKNSSLPPTNCLGFEFASNHYVYLRPSGTEPKIKLYFLLNFPYELKKSQSGLEKIQKIEKDLQNFFQSLIYV